MTPLASALADQGRAHLRDLLDEHDLNGALEDSGVILGLKLAAVLLADRNDRTKHAAVLLAIADLPLPQR